MGWERAGVSPECGRRGVGCHWGRGGGGECCDERTLVADWTLDS